MFVLKNVSKRYGTIDVIHHISFSVPEKNCLAIIGPSGSGKSTILRIMLGLTWPDEGEVSLKGDRLCADNIKNIRSKIGYVIQGGGLFPHLTARENVVLPAEQRQWSPEKIKERLETLCKIARFPKNRLPHYPSQLSGGEKQRVSLMRALILDREILLLDEPLGALDPWTRSELQEELKELFNLLGKTVVLVTHDFWEAQFLCNHLVMIHKGRIQFQGTFDGLSETTDPFLKIFKQPSHV